MLKFTVQLTKDGNVIDIKGLSIDDMNLLTTIIANRGIDFGTIREK